MVKSKVFVRSVLDLGDFNDDEKNSEPSLTDPSQDEPIEALVARMLRGEIVGRVSPQYDTDGSLSPAECFARQSVVSKDGFDLADAPVIMERAKAAGAALKEKSDDQSNKVEASKSETASSDAKGSRPDAV